jgi:hypothetical protein
MPVSLAALEWLISSAYRPGKSTEVLPAMVDRRGVKPVIVPGGMA